MLKEEWRSLNGIVESGEFYEISSFGNVKNGVSQRILAFQVKKNGYLQVQLSNKQKHKKYYIHRLVALAFIPNPENKTQVNHKNGNKSDNSLYNLEWVTPKDNMKHCYDTGLRNQLGSKNRMAVLTEDDVLKIKEIYTTTKCTQYKLAELFNVSKQTINNILRGKSWSHVPIDKEIKIHNKGKQGENNSQSKLSDNDVATIKKSLIEGVSQYELAKRFNISRSVIGFIQNGKRWSHVKVDDFTPYTKDSKGENNIKSKLNADEVRQIRNLYKTGKYSYGKLSKMFGVTKSPIQRILKGKSWTHVE